MEWVYKAKDTKIGYIDTMILATRRGFLCRSAREPAGSWADNVRKVRFGDIIHFYFIDERGNDRAIGSFEVIDPATDIGRHPRPHLFGDTVDGCALKRIVDQAFADHLGSLGGKEGYKVDPELGVFTGWALVRSDKVTPKYKTSLFGGQATLQEYYGT